MSPEGIATAALPDSFEPAELRLAPGQPGFVVAASHGGLVCVLEEGLHSLQSSRWRAGCFLGSYAKGQCDARIDAVPGLAPACRSRKQRL
jgi:hypothetical protein